MNLENFIDCTPSRRKEHARPTVERYPTSIGPKLRQFRLSRKMTAAEMASIVGVHHATWGHYEIGKRGVPKETLDKICEHFGVTVEEIEKLEGVGNVRRPRIGRPIPALHIELQNGFSITADELLKKVPSDAEHVYYKPEEGRVYWTRGEEKGEEPLE